MFAEVRFGSRGGGQSSRGIVIARPEALLHVIYSTVQGDSCGCIGLVGQDEFFQASDDLIVWDSQGIDVKAQHAGNDGSQIKKLETKAR